MRVWGMGIGLLVLAATAAMAAETVVPGNTVITSKTLTFDYKRYVAVFEGDVVVVDPQMRMEAARLNVIFEGTNQIKTVSAQGNVRIRHGDKTATCDRAMYTAQAGEILLTGDAVLSRGEDRVMGDTITFWLNDDRMTCTPGRLIIGPQAQGPSAGLIKPQAAPARAKTPSSAPRQIRATTPPAATRP